MRMTLVGICLLMCVTSIGCRTPAAAIFGSQLSEAVFRSHAQIRTFPAPLTATTNAVQAALDGQGVKHDGFMVDGEVNSKTAQALSGPDKDGTVTLAPGQVKVSSVSVSGKTSDGRALTLQIAQKPGGSEVAVMVGTVKEGNDKGYCNALLDRVAQTIVDQAKSQVANGNGPGVLESPALQKAGFKGDLSIK